MQANIFDFSQMLTLATVEQPYLEFLRVSSLAVGVYVLEVGSTDHQIPHSEDEVYYVASGRAKMKTGSEENTRSFAVGPGTIIFVPARLDHLFYDISERLSVLVFFAAGRSMKVT